MALDWATAAEIGTAAGTLVSTSIYIAAGDTGFWPGALREPDETAFGEAAKVIADRSALTIDVLYGDTEGGQRVITRFGLLPGRDDSWLLRLASGSGKFCDVTIGKNSNV